MAELSRSGERAERSETAAVMTQRPDPGGTLAVAAAGTLLILVAFTTLLTTLASTAASLGAGPGAQAHHQVRTQGRPPRGVPRT